MSGVALSGLFFAKTTVNCKEAKAEKSYYTVKTESALRDAVNLSHKGDTIVITGDIVLNSVLVIPKDKELTISNDGKIRTLKRGNMAGNMIYIDKSTLTLKGLNGTDESPSLLIDGNGNEKPSGINGQIIKNDGVFNMYTGVSLQNNKIKPDFDFFGHNGSVNGIAIFCLNNATFNMYGGTINTNQLDTSMNKYNWSYKFNGIICLSPGSTFNIWNGIISNNISSNGCCSPTVIYCKSESKLNINGGKIEKNNGRVYCEKGVVFNMTGGNIAKNNGGVYCDKGAVVNMTGGRISENSDSIYILGKFIMSGGSIDHNGKHLVIGGEFILSQDAQIVANSIYLYDGKQIVIDGSLKGNDDSYIYISLPTYRLFNTQRIIDVVNGANISNVLGKFRLTNEQYGINAEGYVDDAYQDIEKIDRDTGIKISSCENALNIGTEVKVTKADSIDSIKDSTFYIEISCGNNSCLYSVSFISDGKKYIPEKTDKISFCVPIKDYFNVGKIPQITLYDSNKNAISDGGEIRAEKGVLYIKISAQAD